MSTVTPIAKRSSLLTPLPPIGPRTPSHSATPAAAAQLQATASSLTSAFSPAATPALAQAPPAAHSASLASHTSMQIGSPRARGPVIAGTISDGQAAAPTAHLSASSQGSFYLQAAMPLLPSRAAMPLLASRTSAVIAPVSLTTPVPPSVPPSGFLPGSADSPDATPIAAQAWQGPGQILYSASAQTSGVSPAVPAHASQSAQVSIAPQSGSHASLHIGVAQENGTPHSGTSSGGQATERSAHLSMILQDPRTQIKGMGAGQAPTMSRNWADDYTKNVLELAKFNIDEDRIEVCLEKLKGLTAFSSETLPLPVSVMNLLKDEKAKLPSEKTRTWLHRVMGGSIACEGLANIIPNNTTDPIWVGVATAVAGLSLIAGFASLGYTIRLNKNSRPAKIKIKTALETGAGKYAAIAKKILVIYTDSTPLCGRTRDFTILELSHAGITHEMLENRQKINRDLINHRLPDLKLLLGICAPPSPADEPRVSKFDLIRTSIIHLQKEEAVLTADETAPFLTPIRDAVALIDEDIEFRRNPDADRETPVNSMRSELTELRQKWELRINIKLDRIAHQFPQQMPSGGSPPHRPALPPLQLPSSAPGTPTHHQRRALLHDGTQEGPSGMYTDREHGNEKEPLLPALDAPHAAHSGTLARYVSEAPSVASGQFRHRQLPVLPAAAPFFGAAVPLAGSRSTQTSPRPHLPVRQHTQHLSVDYTNIHTPGGRRPSRGAGSGRARSHTKSGVYPPPHAPTVESTISAPESIPGPESMSAPFTPATFLRKKDRFNFAFTERDGEEVEPSAGMPKASASRPSSATRAPKPQSADLSALPVSGVESHSVGTPKGPSRPPSATDKQDRLRLLASAAETLAPPTARLQPFSKIRRPQGPRQSIQDASPSAQSVQSAPETHRLDIPAVRSELEALPLSRSATDPRSQVKVNKGPAQRGDTFLYDPEGAQAELPV